MIKLYKVIQRYSERMSDMKDLLQLYRDLYDFTKKQKELIDEGDFDKLFKVLQEKDKLIEQIDKRDLKSYLKGEKKPERVYKTIQDLMKKTKELEDENIAELQEKSSDIKAKMQELSQKENRRKGYNQKNSYEAKFIDKKS